MPQTERSPWRAGRRRAYAKINLYLDVGPGRADGYHTVETVMQSISLHDDIRVLLRPAREATVSLRVWGARLPTDGRNLAFRAAEAYLRALGRPLDVRITLRKTLPVAAGLAGGSSNAAAVLLAMNDALGRPLSSDILLSLAADLGSDVPFCLLGGTRLCRGRGEVTEPLSLARGLFIVVAVGGRERVSTPAAFARMDTYYHNLDGSVPHGGDLPALLGALGAGELPRSGDDLLYNAFEPVILPGCPVAASLRERLLSLGAFSAHMSGSGPSVFGLFRTEAAAREAAAAIGRGAWYAVPVPENK